MAEEKKEIIHISSFQMETKNFTLGRYDYNEVQQNVITLIQEQLQEYMTKDARQAEITLDSMGEPFIEIDTKDLSGKKDKQEIIEKIEEMYKKPVKFRWRDASWGKNIKTSCPIVIAVHDLEGTTKIRVNYNRWAIPFLIWYGKSIGGTRYDKTISLTINGKYTKRIYKLLCAYKDKKEYYYSINEFREDFALPKSYTITNIDKLVLKKAKEEINNSRADVNFDYTLVKPEKWKGKKPVIGIQFYITWKKKRENMSDAEFQIYNKAYMYLNRCDIDTSKVVSVCDLLSDHGLLKLIIDKWEFYEDCVARGDIWLNGQRYTTAIIRNIMKKLIREELEKRGVDPRQIGYLYPKK